MFLWIELGRDDDQNVWVRADSIHQIVPTTGGDGETVEGSMVVTANNTAYFVKELPDEIMVAIDIAERRGMAMTTRNEIHELFFERYPDVQRR